MIQDAIDRHLCRCAKLVCIVAHAIQETLSDFDSLIFELTDKVRQHIHYDRTVSLRVANDLDNEWTLKVNFNLRIVLEPCPIPDLISANR